MKAERWDRLKDLVFRASELDEAERASFLESECGDDAALRAEVESLLRFESETAGSGALVTRSLARQDTQPDSGAARPGGPRSGESGGSGGRFGVGQVVAGRYRIIERLGAGGMGEVYRADDLVLDHPVALKFLPSELARDPHALRRLRGEVRIARQVSHPNVCRVYDIGQTGQQHFLSMEYIRGEDLKSLLQRVGRLPPEKALEIAVQIASGLAAAHDLGVLHRDLKPANVMFDVRGQARIADFGLAAAAGTIETRDIPAGTPAYMAPEQLSGAAVSERSDVYSLGLVLYELFTGRRAPETRGTSPDGGITPPSAIVQGLDPAVERLILRCLASDPGERPASAAAVRAELPGGDPLAAAVARGETPAPALVAQGGDQRGLSRGQAWLALGSFSLSLLGTVWLSGATRLTSLVPLERSPELLTADAREILERLGHTAPRRDSTFGFLRDVEYLDHLQAAGEPPPWREELARGEPAVIRFWYRESPRYLVPYRSTEFFPTLHDPPLVVPGMVSLELDTRGRLRRLEAVPAEEDAGESDHTPDWESLLAVAGLEAERLEPATLAATAGRRGEIRAAWTGVYPESPDVPIRLEATASAGRVVSFRVHEPWSRTEAPGWTSAADVTGNPLARLLHLGAHLGLLLGLGLLAQRNLASGRGDRKRAFRLAGFFFAVVLLHWVLAAHHVPAGAQLQIFFGGLYRAFFAAGLGWLFYLALEPYARKLWPRSLTSWVRLLDGRVSDPLVGRDVLIGCVYGAAMGLLQRGAHALPALQVGVTLRPDRPSHPAELLALRGFWDALSELFAIQVNIFTHILFLFGGLLLLRFLLRRTWLAVAVHGCLYVAVYASSYGVVVIGLWIAFWYVVFFRAGWLAIAVGTLFADVLVGFPLTPDLSAWHAHATVLVVVGGLALAVQAFRASLAGTPIVADMLDS